MELRGKTAIVTGGASGIGRATALALARSGVRTVVADRDEPGMHTTVRMIRSAGGMSEAFPCDVTQAEQVMQLVAASERIYGGLDILFNNAGVATGLPAFPDVDSKWRRTLDINLYAVIVGTQLALPALRRRGGGAIVNTASMAAINGVDIDPVYAASKGGVLLFTRSLAGLIAEGIHVNCICPGVIETPFVLAAEDTRMQQMANRFPTLRPEDVAEAVLSLLADDTAAGCALQVSASRPPIYWSPDAGSGALPPRTP